MLSGDPSDSAVGGGVRAHGEQAGAIRRTERRDRYLTRTVRAYAGKLSGFLRCPPQAFAQTWRVGRHGAAGNHAALLPALMTDWVSPGELPGALSRFEAPSDRAHIARTERLESMIADLEAREVETWGEIMNTLELWP